MSELKLIDPKFRKTPRERRKEKQDKIGAGLMGGAAIGFGAAMYKTIEKQIEKDYGKSKGYEAAEKEGFTHTNKAKDFNDEGETKNEKENEKEKK